MYKKSYSIKSIYSARFIKTQPDSLVNNLLDKIFSHKCTHCKKRKECKKCHDCYNDAVDQFDKCKQIA